MIDYLPRTLCEKNIAGFEGKNSNEKMAEQIYIWSSYYCTLLENFTFSQGTRFKGVDTNKNWFFLSINF